MTHTETHNWNGLTIPFAYSLETGNNGRIRTAFAEIVIDTKAEVEFCDFIAFLNHLEDQYYDESKYPIAHHVALLMVGAKGLHESGALSDESKKSFAHSIAHEVGPKAAAELLSNPPDVLIAEMEAEVL